MHPFFSVTLFTGQQLVLEALQRWLVRPCPDAAAHARRRLGLKQLIALLLRTAATGVLATVLDAAIEFRRRQLLAVAAADPEWIDGESPRGASRFPGLGMLSRAGVAAWKSRLLLAIDELERRAVKMQSVAGTKSAVAPQMAAVRPHAARPKAFAGQPSIARPSFAKRVSQPMKASRVQGQRVVVVRAADDKKVVVIGLAADSGCGKSTFMRRVTGIFGGEPKPPAGGNPDSNTLISDMTTVICLDDYHSLDRNGRKEKAVTALAPEAQNFDLMYEQVKALKEGKTVQKPIYNHVTGLLDPPEATSAPNILIVEGLHPFYDDRVNDLMDFRIYLDISDETKFAWKIQRDMAERGHSLESVKASIEARKPDFDAYIDPQKKKADMIIQVLPTQLVPDEKEGKILRVRLIMKDGKKLFDPVYLFDQGSTISWIPCGRKLTCSFPGIKMFYGPDTYYGEEVSVLEMDGSFDKLEELIYMESHLSNTSAKFYGEITQQMLKNSSFPGSTNGTGLFQTIVGLKVREVYERITQKEVVPV